MKKPSFLILIAVWQFITAFAALGIGFAVIAIFALPDFSGSGQSFDSMSGQNQMGLSVIVLFLLCFMALAVAGGFGLLLNRGREWARVFSIISSALSLVFFPIGTIFGILSIIYLTKQEVRDYFNPPPPPP